jgi:hypothetical protein
MLSTAQLETFKRDGAIVFRGFYSAGEIDSWREQILHYFDHPKNGTEWRNALARHKADDFRLIPDPTPSSHSALSRIYQALHATADWIGHNQLVVRAGDDAAEWRGARLAHIDIPLYAPVRTLANNVTYLSDVGERGGAFMYWPASHHVAWEYFREFPDDYMARGERTHNQVFEHLVERAGASPVEFTGGPGDLLIWHSLLLHSASVNKHPGARLAVFGRWGVRIEDEALYDFREDMEAYWRFGQSDTMTADINGRATKTEPRQHVAGGV